MEEEEQFRRPASVEEHNEHERGIPEVADLKKPGRFLLLIVGGLCLWLLLWAINRDDEAPNPGLTEQQPEEFRVTHNTNPPRLVIEEKETPVPNQSNPVNPEINAALKRSVLREAEAERKRLAARQRAPILIVNQRSKIKNVQPTHSTADLSTESPLFPQQELKENTANQFAAQASREGVDSVSASWIRNPSYTLTQGTTIEGVLETAIQSDLPGWVRATVAHPVYALDGNELLVPKGSRLIGKYQSGIARGQKRIYIVWTRIITPKGASILLGSPGTDPLGRTGLTGAVDTHFFEIFGASILLSVVDGVIATSREAARKLRQLHHCESRR